MPHRIEHLGRALEVLRVPAAEIPVEGACAEIIMSKVILRKSTGWFPHWKELAERNIKSKFTALCVSHLLISSAKPLLLRNRLEKSVTAPVSLCEHQVLFSNGAASAASRPFGSCFDETTSLGLSSTRVEAASSE